MTIEGTGDSTSLALAERDLRLAAVPSNSFQARAWQALGTTLRWQARPAEANVAARRAYELDAFMERADDLLEQLCATSFELGQLSDADGWCAEGRRRFPKEFAFPYYLLQMMPLSSPGRPRIDSAWVLLGELERTTPAAERAGSRPGWRMMVAGVIARAGLPDSARRVLAAARRAGTGKADLDVYDAIALLVLGDQDAALERLQSYLAKHPSNGALVAAHPSFASLRENARFRTLVLSREQAK
jgi:hypothetical protein